MYATIRRYEDVTDPAEAGRRVSEGFVPLIKQIPGFVAYYWVDAGEGIMASTSVFENRAGAEASTERAADWVRENIASLLPTPPIATGRRPGLNPAVFRPLSTPRCLSQALPPRGTLRSLQVWLPCPLSCELRCSPSG